MNYQGFKSIVLGHAYDIDGSFGAQCWDGYAQYCRMLGVPFAYCTRSNYVRDIWELRKQNGILNYFDEVTVMRPGDVAVFKIHPATPYSHIAIFDSDAGGGYGWFLGQNQIKGNPAYSIVKLPYAATYDTAFRPKNLSAPAPSPTPTVTNGIPSDAVAEKGTFTITSAMPIRIRTAPSTKSGDTGVVYEKGQSVNYDYYIKREGYVWISWIGQSGTRRWMATGVLDAQGRNSSPWGVFK